MKVSKTKNRFKIGTSLPKKTGINIPSHNIKLTKY